MKTLRFLAWTFALLVSAASAPAEEPLRFGVIPTESAGGLRRDYEPLRVALAGALGRPVEMYFAPDYTSVIEAMRFDRIQLALLGNNSAIDAVDRAGAVVIAQAIDRSGEPGYWSLLLVPQDSPIHTLEDLLARRATTTLGLGDAQSTSGNLVPGYYAFGRNGVNPARDFKAVRQANHEANILAVANHQIDACATSSDTLVRVLERQPALAKRVREIWRSPLIASDPLVVKNTLPEETRLAIRAFFVGYGTAPEGRAVLEKLTWSAFRESTNAQLIPFRVLRLRRERRLIENDPDLGETTRSERLAALDARVAALEVETP